MLELVSWAKRTRLKIDRESAYLAEQKARQGVAGLSGEEAARRRRPGETTKRIRSSA